MLIVHVEEFIKDFFCLLVVLPPVSAVSPPLVEQFSWDMRNHPNPQLVAFILEGLRNGFKLGFNHSQNLKSATLNKPSIYEHPAVIDEYLANEVSLGRVISVIAYKELFPVVIAAFVWGHQWYKRHVLFCSDNDVVAHMLNSRTLKTLCLM